MDVIELLEELEDIIGEGKELPFVKKVAVDGEDILALVDEIKEHLPDELKQAKWITEERVRILQEAKKEAEDIVKEAERKIIEMVDEHEITKKAEEKALKIIEDAKIQSREISEGTKEYSDARLEEAEISLTELAHQMQLQIDYVEEAIQRVKGTRRELRR